jgi:hypothetical protein
MKMRMRGSETDKSSLILEEGGEISVKKNFIAFIIYLSYFILLNRRS